MSTVRSNANIVPSTSQSMPEPSPATSISETSSNVFLAIYAVYNLILRLTEKRNFKTLTTGKRLLWKKRKRLEHIADSGILIAFYIHQPSSTENLQKKSFRPYYLSGNTFKRNSAMFGVLGRHMSYVR